MSHLDDCSAEAVAAARAVRDLYAAVGKSIPQACAHPPLAEIAQAIERSMFPVQLEIPAEPRRKGRVARILEVLVS